MGQLRVISDHLEGTFELPDKPWKIGRGNDCDIQLVHKSISRHHCIISERDGELRIEDLGSTYGTYVNGTQMTDGYARYGDKIRLGRILLVFESETPTGVFQRPSTIISPPASVPQELPVAQVVKQAPVNAPRSAPPTAPRPAGPATSPPPTPPEDTPKFNLAPAQPAAKRTSSAFKKPEPEKWSMADHQKKADAEKLTPQEARNQAIEKIESAPTKDEPAKQAAVGGAFNRLHGGHKKKKKAAKSDYTAEASDWEDQVAAMEDGEGPDYAAEADDWEQVWGKEKKRKGFFSGGGGLGGFFSIFGGLDLKMRMMVIVGMMMLFAGLGNFAYQKATAQILVPKKKVRTNPSTGLERGDKVLDKAVDTFRKIIPKELQSEKPVKGQTGKKVDKDIGKALETFKKIIPKTGDD
jgi:hypothetical protein